MNKSFLKQLWLATRIWLLAVAVNAILGTVYLAESFHSVADLAMIGLVYGAIYSFPVMIAILLVINRYSANDKSGLLVFRAVVQTGVALTVVVFIAFWIMMGLDGVLMFLALQCIAILSGIIGMTAFNRSIVKWGRVRNHAQKV